MDIDLSRLVDACAGLKVVVIGDVILDIYLEGGVDRLCREEPLGVVEVERREENPGGAGNAAVNVHALGGLVEIISVVGEDIEGMALRRALEQRGVSSHYLVCEAGRGTLAKHRLIGASRMLARFDQGSGNAIRRATEEQLVSRLSEAVTAADAIIVSDYGYGLFTPRVVGALTRLQRRSPRIMVVDSREPARFTGVGATVVKPNFHEALRLLGEDFGGRGGRAEFIASRGERILERCGARVATVTLDADGVMVLERGRPPYRTYARPERQSRSIGSGDTFVAALSLALAAGAETPAAAELASAAAAVVLGKDGTAACSALELKDSITGGEKRVADLSMLGPRLAFYRGQGRRIVFTNGCFDILHRGHVALLNRAKSLGDVLVVGINSDAGVHALKGPGRPINGLEDRIKVLAALSYIDHVIAFDDDTPSEIIKTVRPDIFVKGGDYTRESLPEAALVERLGGVVCILPYVEDRSTSGIIERIRGVAS